MVKSKSLYHLALAGVLCAIGIIIPIFSPVKIRLDPMSFTLASHVAIFLAMFISPAVGVAVSVGTTLGFLVGGFTMPVVLRALTHVVWVALGAYYLQKHPELIDFRQQVENRCLVLVRYSASSTRHWKPWSAYRFTSVRVCPARKPFAFCSVWCCSARSFIR